MTQFYGEVAPEREMRIEDSNRLAVNKKSENVTLITRIRRQFQEYTGRTSIHGLQYIGEKKRPLFERIWWSVVFLSSIGMCGYLIYKVWYKWSTRPVIVSFSETSTPIWQIPFPAVTICSESKAKQSVFNFTQAYYEFMNRSISKADYKKFTDLSLVCDISYYDQKAELTTNGSSVDFLEEVAPTLKEIGLYCTWHNKLVPCEKLFSPILTEDGLCYTFNILDSNDFFQDIVKNTSYYINHGNLGDSWSLDGGYLRDAPVVTYPHRAMVASNYGYLILTLKSNKIDSDFLCRGPVQGFKIILHNPAEFPVVSQHYYRAPFDEEVLVAIRPNMLTTSETLRGYDPKQRQCYFPTERHLLFFKVYTQQNCEVECLSNYTNTLCGCVPFFMPRNSSTPICASGSRLCIAKTKDQLAAKDLQDDINELRNNDTDLYFYYKVKGKLVKYEYEDCECLPECTKLEYNAEISQAVYNWKPFYDAKKRKYNKTAENYLTKVKIFFIDTQFITSKRSELYGMTDFLANCGGLLGLFMGFSFLSVVEFFYFFGIRTCSEHKNKVKDECA